MTIPNDIREKAREIVDKVLPRPDWVSCKEWEDCFVCGTPLSPEKYAERSEYIVQAISLAILAERERCAEIARNWYAPDLEFNKELAIAILTPDGEKHEAK